MNKMLRDSEFDVKADEMPDNIKMVFSASADSNKRGKKFQPDAAQRVATMNDLAFEAEVRGHFPASKWQVSNAQSMRPGQFSEYLYPFEKSINRKN